MYLAIKTSRADGVSKYPTPLDRDKFVAIGLSRASRPGVGLRAGSPSARATDGHGDQQHSEGPKRPHIGQGGRSDLNSANQIVYTTAMSNDLPMNAENGPAMKALPNDRWRHFAVLYCGQGQHNATRAYAIAFEKDLNDKGQYHYCETRGPLMVRDERMQAAVLELSKRQLRGILPRAVKALENIVDNPQHAAHFAAVKDALDRGGAHAITEHHQMIQHLGDDGDMVKQIAALATMLNIDPQMLLGRHIEPPTIDVTPTVVVQPQFEEPETW